MLGTRGLLIFGLVVAIIAGGVWAWQAGYVTEIGKFFAADLDAPLPADLANPEPTSGPVGTHVVIKGDHLPADGQRVPVHFGGGVIDGVSAGWYVEFDVPSEMPVYCPPGAYCILSLIPVQPGSYSVMLETGTACPTYSPNDLPTSSTSSEVAEECGVVRSNAVTFTVTAGACTPLPRCVYEGPVRCAVDPAPGTIFCSPPTPTVSPTPSCLPLPPCVNDPVAPCSIRPAPGMVYCPMPTLIPTCVPRPACLDSSPRCLPPEPITGWCPSRTPTPTPSGPPGQLGRVNLNLDTPQSQVEPGKELQVNVWLDSRGQGVTAAKIVLRTASNASFVGFVPTPDLVEVLAAPAISPDKLQLNFTLGSGPRQGGVVGSHINLGKVTLRVDDAAGLQNNPAGDKYVSLLVGDGTAIAVSGSERNELNGYSSLTLPISSARRPGDLDGNGTVDIFDYNIIVSNFGKTGPNLGDVDGNGTVDIFDYNIVISNFNRIR